MFCFLDPRMGSAYGWQMWIRTTLLIVGICLSGGCADPLYNYSECVDIETARCDLRTACKEKDAASFEQKFPDFDRETCLTYAKENCRVREIKGEGWTADDIDACVKAILALQNHQCADLNPKTDETTALRACWFIEAPDDQPDDTDQDTDSATDE